MQLEYARTKATIIISGAPRQKLAQILENLIKRPTIEVVDGSIHGDGNNLSLSLFVRKTACKGNWESDMKRTIQQSIIQAGSTASYHVEKFKRDVLMHRTIENPLFVSVKKIKNDRA